MGYFPNSDAGLAYEAQYCDRCVHQKPDNGGCAVWLAHMLFNYGTADQAEVLNVLIPRDGIVNLQCRMFVAKANEAP